MRKITKLLMALVLTLFGWQANAQNGGDDCANAVVALEGNFTATTINDVTAGTANGDSAWFVYTATADGLLNISSCSGGADTRVFLFDACGGTELATSDDAANCPVNTDGTGSSFASRIENISVTNGEDYFIQWDDRWSVAPFNWSITLVTCANPDDAAVTATGTTTADATWTASFGAANYDWEVVPTGNGQGVGVVASGNETGTTASITGLTEDTTYDFFISADCLGTYAGPVTFTTDPSCTAPDMLAVSNILADAATINWNDTNTPNANGYEYELVDITGGGAFTGTPTATVPALGGTTLNLTGLTVDNEYEIYIRSNCGSGLGSNFSPWSAALNWTQTELPGCASGFMPMDGATGITPGTVTLSWTAPTTGGTVADYDILFGTDPMALASIGQVTDVTVAVNGIGGGTFYYQIVPRNAAGGSAVGCPIIEFTTNPLDDGGADCASATLVTEGTYVSQINDASGGTNGGDEAWFQYNVPTNVSPGTLNINSCNGGGDTRLFVYDDCANVGVATVAENDDDCPTGNGNNFASQVEFAASTGDTYYIEWDDRWEEGVFTWNITYTPECPNVTTWDGAMWDNGAPTTDSYAIINGAYSTVANGNLDVCAIQVNATLTVDAATFVRANGTINVTATGVMNVAHTANVVQVDDAATMTNDGAINVNVSTPMLGSRDFMILGSPVSGETREDVWSAAYNVRFYSTASFVPNTDVAATGVTYNFASANTDDWNLLNAGALMPGEGYLVFPQDSFNGAGGIFDYTYNTGTLNNGVVTRGLTFNTTAADSPNMFSNPYASGIDADLFLAANPEIDAVYFWEHLTDPDAMTPGAYANNFNMDDISVYNAMGGLAAANGGIAPTGVIATSQGFGVFASAAGTTTFNNGMRVTTGNTTLRSSDDRDRLWLNVTSETYGLGSNALVGFTQDATSGYDTAYDNPRIATTISLHSNIEGDLENGYSIQGREAFNMDMQIPFSFATNIDELTSYRISLSDFDGAAWDTAHVYLVDNATGNVTNLSKTDYVFTSEMGNFNGRFTVQFRDNTLATEDVLLSDITFYPNPTTGIINVTSPNASISRVNVTDIQGRVIENFTINSTNNYALDMTRLESAVYFVTVTTDAGSITKRIIRK